MTDSPCPPSCSRKPSCKLEERFGAVSCETQTIRGSWQQEGETYRDELVRAFVDAEDLPAHRQYFLDLKEQLKTRFRQHDIWMTTYPIEVL